MRGSPHGMTSVSAPGFAPSMAKKSPKKLMACCFGLAVEKLDEEQYHLCMKFSASTTMRAYLLVSGVVQLLFMLA